MKCLSGKVMDFQAVIGATAPSSCRTKVMVCLEDVSTSEGLFREHCWIEREDGYPSKGTKVKLKARIRKYFSHFEGLNQISKIGLSSVKNLKEMR